ncbi:MAG: Lrp/AsnC family transcriptional regulator [Pseudomonadales bacterium]|nr:Lrp/AsnC family transcriptional regulator [Pseudomonadales bacterium]
MKPSDTKLLSLLRENGRRSTSELARELSVSRSTIQSRIRKLEQTGIIKRYTVEYGSAYEDRLISAQVLIVTHQKMTTRTNQALRAIPQINALYAISGDFDLLALIKTESTEELSHVLDDIGNLAGVERTHSSLILETKFIR